MPAGLAAAISLHKLVAADVAPLGGLLHCQRCDGTRRLPGAAAIERYLRNGWPRHCGATMTWYTQRQVDSGEVPADAWPLQ